METRSERRNTISSVKGRKEKVSVLQDKDNVRKKIKQRADRGDGSNVSAVRVKMEQGRGWRRAVQRRAFNTQQKNTTTTAAAAVPHSHNRE